MPSNFEVTDRPNVENYQVSIIISNKIKFRLFSQAEILFKTFLKHFLKIIYFQVAKYQNSYRVESQNPFKVEPVEKILETWMNNIFENASYDVNESPKLCAQVATEIRKRVQMLAFDRFVIFIINFHEK